MATTHEIDALMIRIVADASNAIQAAKDVEEAFEKMRESGRSGGGPGGGGGGRGLSGWRPESDEVKAAKEMAAKIKERVFEDAAEKQRMAGEAASRDMQRDDERRQRQAAQRQADADAKDLDRMAKEAARDKKQKEDLARSMDALDEKNLRSQQRVRDRSEKERRQGLLDAAVDERRTIDNREKERRQNLLISARREMKDQEKLNKDLARAEKAARDEEERKRKASAGPGIVGRTGGFVTDAFGSVIAGVSAAAFYKVLNLAQSVASSIYGVFEAIGTGVKDIATQSVLEFAKIEQAQVAFGVLVQDEAKGLKMVSDLQALSAKTPLSMDVLQQSARMLLQYGAAGENVIPILQILGDISGGNAQQMRHLTKAYADVTSVGRLLGTELRQFTNAGFNPLESIAKKTGKTVGQLRDEMKHGLNPSLGDVTQAMIDATSQGGRFFGLMDKMSNTLAGSWRRAQSQALIALQELGAGISKGLGLKDMGTDLAAALNTYGMPAIREFSKTLSAFGPAWQQVRDAAVAAWEWTSPVREALGDLFTAIRENALVLWNAFYQNAANAWDRISAAAGISWGEVRDSIVAGIDYATFVITNFEKVSGTVWDEMGYRAQQFWQHDLPKYVAEGLEQTVRSVISWERALRNLSGIAYYQMIFGEPIPAAEAKKMIDAAKAHMDKYKQMLEDLEKFRIDLEEQRARRRDKGEDIIFGGIPDAAEKTKIKIDDVGVAVDKMMHKFDAAAYGSAEAASRIEASVGRVVVASQGTGVTNPNRSEGVSVGDALDELNKFNISDNRDWGEVKTKFDTALDYLKRIAEAGGISLDASSLD